MGRFKKQKRHRSEHHRRLKTPASSQAISLKRQKALPNKQLKREPMSFMVMPAEVRTRIFEYLFDKDNEQPFPPPLSAVSKTIRAECLPIFFQDLRLEFTLTFKRQGVTRFQPYPRYALASRLHNVQFCKHNGDRLDLLPCEMPDRADPSPYVLSPPEGLDSLEAVWPCKQRFDGLLAYQTSMYILQDQRGPSYPNSRDTIVLSLPNNQTMNPPSAEILNKPGVRTPLVVALDAELKLWAGRSTPLRYSEALRLALLDCAKAVLDPARVEYIRAQGRSSRFGNTTSRAGLGPELLMRAGFW